MEENCENTPDDSKISTEEIKKEATDTVNQVKETIKSTNLKEDANEAKNFFKNFFKKPVEEINSVANSSNNEFFKIGIAILVIWLVATFINETVSIFKSYSYYISFDLFFRRLFTNVFSIIKEVIAPVLSIIIFSATIYFMKKDDKKSFIHIATTTLIAKIPVVIACVAQLLGLFSNQIYKLTNPFSIFCSTVSNVLLYFAIKFLYNEKQDSIVFKKFVIILGIFYIAKFILSFLEFYI